MPLPDIFRDSFVGDIVRFISGRRLLQYPEERAGFVVPPQYASTSPSALGGTSASSITTRAAQDGSDLEGKKQHVVVGERAETLVDEHAQPPQESTLAREYLHPSQGEDVEKADLSALEPAGEDAQRLEHLVDWYGPDDPDCPLNVRTRLMSARSLLMRHPVVVHVQTLSCHLRYLPHHLHHLHRRRSLRPWHTGYGGEVRYIPSSGITGPHDVRRRIRRRAHVPFAAVRDPTARSSAGVHGHAHRVRSSPSAHCSVEKPRCDHSAAVPRGVLRLSSVGDRRSVACRHLAAWRPSCRTRTVRPCGHERARCWTDARQLRSTTQGVDVDDVDSAMARQCHCVVPGYPHAGNLSPDVSIEIHGELTYLTDVCAP